MKFKFHSVVITLLLLDAAGLIRTSVLIHNLSTLLDKCAAENMRLRGLKTVEIRMPANDTDPLCDFCSDRSVKPVAALLVKTREFSLENDPVRRVSEGEWYVCRPCLDCILAHDTVALRERAVETFLVKNRAYVAMCGSVEEVRAALRRDTPTVHRQALDQLLNWPTRY